MYTSRGRFVCQCPVAFATDTRPTKMQAMIVATATGESPRRRHLSDGVAALFGTNENCKAFSAGHAATHARRILHQDARSDEILDIAQRGIPAKFRPVQSLVHVGIALNSPHRVQRIKRVFAASSMPNIQLLALRQTKRRTARRSSVTTRPFPKSY